jgi:predicted membrane GTPase involved in stress response
MSKKKEHNPVEALKKAFEEEINDLELQGNYDRFQKNLERAKDAHNKLVPLLNQNVEARQILADVVYKSAMEGILSIEATKKVKELEAEMEVLVAELEIHKESMDYNKKLIENYKDWSCRKLFIWWQALKAVDPETEAYIEWKETYKDRII